MKKGLIERIYFSISFAEYIVLNISYLPPFGPVSSGGIMINLERFNLRRI